jgi:hypothetical protein
MNASLPTCKALARRVAFPVVTTLVVSVVHSFSPQIGLLLFAIALLAIVVWVAVMAYCMVAVAWGRALRDSLQRLMLLASAAALMAAAFLSGDYVHLAIMYPFYASQIRNVDHSGEIVFNWGGTGFGGSGNSERALVYYPRGTLKAEVGAMPLPAEPAVSVSTNHLLGHFYIREMSW